MTVCLRKNLIPLNKTLLQATDFFQPPLSGFQWLEGKTKEEWCWEGRKLEWWMINYASIRWFNDTRNKFYYFGLVER